MTTDSTHEDEVKRRLSERPLFKMVRIDTVKRMTRVDDLVEIARAAADDVSVAFEAEGLDRLIFKDPDDASNEYLISANDALRCFQEALRDELLAAMV